MTYLCRDHWSPGQKGPFKIFEVRIALFRFCHCLISSHRWKLWPYASTNQRADSRSQKRPTRRTTWFEACRLGMVNANGRILLYIYTMYIYIQWMETAKEYPIYLYLYHFISICGFFSFKLTKTYSQRWLILWRLVVPASKKGVVRLDDKPEW